MPRVSEVMNESRIISENQHESGSLPQLLSGTEELFSEAFSKKLESLASENAETYRRGKPFSHIYFDDFLPVGAAEGALRDFPEPKQLDWAEFNRPKERKLAFDQVEK